MTDLLKIKQRHTKKRKHKRDKPRKGNLREINQEKVNATPSLPQPIYVLPPNLGITIQMKVFEA